MEETNNLKPLGMVDNHNYGIDILRIISMFMICVLHTLNQGGVLVHCDQNGIINWPQYNMAWTLEIATYGCVNLYALVSGYVGINSKFKPSRVLSFMAEILFYTLLITLFFQIKYPSLVNGKVWFKAIFPVMNQEYWYVTAYFGLLIIMPFLNAGLKNIDNKYLVVFSIASMLYFSLFPILFKSGAFNLGAGYSLIWLLILYIFGGAIRRLNLERIPPYIGVIIYILMVVITYNIPDSRYVDYTSPTILLGSIGLLLSCVRIKINNKKPLKFILKLLGEATLAVYLIHVHPLIWNKYINDFAVKLHMTENPSVVLLFFKIMLAGLVILVFGLVVDIVRIYLFKLIRLKQGLGKIDSLYEKIGKKKENETL